MNLSYNTDYMFRIPNSLICDPALNKKTLLTYIFIHRQRLYEGGAALSLEMLIEESGYTVSKCHRPISKQFKGALQYLLDQNLIILPDPVDTYSIRDYMGIELLDDFLPAKNYTQISVKEIMVMLDNRNGTDSGNLVATYLYLKSKIGSQRKTLCCTQEMVATGLGLSKATVQRCCSCLEELGLICVHNGIYVRQRGKRAYMPNIYALKVPGWEAALSESIQTLEASCNVKMNPLEKEAVLN